MAQNWPKSDPKSPAYTPSNPKVAPKCKQSGHKFTPQLHKIIKIYWKNVYFSKTHQNDSKDSLMHTKYPKVTETCRQSAQSGATVAAK